MPKKVIIAAGGTGGHVYPAIGFANQLRKEDPETEVLFVGGGLSTNKYFDRDTYHYKSIDCGTFARKSPRQCLSSCWNILKGIKQSRQIFSEFPPQLVVGFGSYYSLPTLLAARLQGIPIVLHEQNSIPGKVIRFFSKKAIVTGIHFPDAANYLKGKTKTVRMPMREGFGLTACTKEHACSFYGFDSSRPVLLVFGGSQGARYINHLLQDTIKGGLFPELQLLIFTGDSTIASEIQKCCSDLNIPAVVKTYEPRMDMAWRAANMFISRSGAGTISEAIEYEVPGILIPYPLAADNHQDKNADFLVSLIGGAMKFQEKELDAAKLGHVLQTLILDEGKKLKKMHNAISSFKKISSQTDFTSVVKEILEQRIHNR
jgi:UDP-N-acetylglucosamine--N-acetylmuramyl-(pentapeptide) pyrophosphoryl-undecaprenol N-acetylglucosamine transferase